MRKIIVLILSVIVIGACSSIDCPVKNRVYTVYTLLKSNGTIDTLTVDTLTILTHCANDSDTILLNHETNFSDFDIPISHTQPEDVLFLTLLDTLGNTYHDTIRVQKENYQHFESVDCQATYFHKLTGVSSTHHIIDTIEINNPTVNYDATNEHFHIYFKARY